MSCFLIKLDMVVSTSHVVASEQFKIIHCANISTILGISMKIITTEGLFSNTVGSWALNFL